VVIGEQLSRWLLYSSQLATAQTKKLVEANQIGAKA
jgi:hypothetical protein